ncbi:hypothetical protein HG530_007524 [Fusarium avenaceum]|nr:hypothetical protein HG530_007524 [Fusarium avenaceum]
MVTLRSSTRQRAQRSSNNIHSSIREITKHASWDFLPQDIRRLILEIVSRQEGWGSAASVCKEWQDFIATKNFGRLELNQSNVHGLTTDIHLPLLRFLVYSKDSRGVDCENLFTKALLDPHDQCHWFKNHLFGFDHEDGDDFTEDLKLLHDPRHGWEHGKQVSAPHTAAILYLFTPFPKDGLMSPNYYAEVPAIKKLIIRRQMRRRIPPDALQVLLERLPQLETITYEPWAILLQLPQSVRSITIFEDFNKHIMKSVRYDSWRYTNTVFDLDTRRVYSNLSCDLANEFVLRSLDLEHLSVSFMINSQHFFEACRAPSTWPRLRSLILTTRIMTKGKHEEIMDEVVAAAAAAQKMPQLETLAIWNQGPMARWSTLTWRGTEELEFSELAIEKWQNVVGDQTLLVKYEKVDGGDIDSHGDAVHHLQLPEGVIDPRSLAQIRKEGKLQKEAWAVVPVNS